MIRHLNAHRPSNSRKALVSLVCAGLFAGFAALTSVAQAAIAPPSDESKAEIQRVLVEEALINGAVPPSLALAVARVESNFDADVVSHAGAIGVMQIMPATARSEFGVPAHRLTDARLNSQLGVAFLHRLYKAYGRRWDLALSHYNGGSLQKVGGVWVAHSYTRDYVNKVMGFWNDFQRERWVQALVSEVGNGGTSVAQAETPQTLPPRTVHEQMAEDYAYLEDPTIDRDWRDYLNVADRWLNAGGGIPEAPAEVPLDEPAAAEETDTAVDFSGPVANNPDWNYPLIEPLQPTHSTDLPSTQSGGRPGPAYNQPSSDLPTRFDDTVVASAGRTPGPGMRDRLKGAERFIYSSEFWKQQTPRARFN